MKWKMFGVYGKLVSVKQNVFKVFRLINGLRSENYNASSHTSVFTVAPYEPVNVLKSYSLGVELKKSKALIYWHTSLDRPK